MTAEESRLYSDYIASVSRQIRSLRVLLSSIEAKHSEREWLSRQTVGDIDDTRLIEGLVGERAVFRRRGERPPEIGALQSIPKRLSFVFDVSASMSRFNGHDGRLDRSMEAAAMMMEAFSGFEHKWKYSIVGHSGDAVGAAFVEQEMPPKTEKERLSVIKKMTAHANYCLSGDSTLQAIQAAIKEIVKKEAGASFFVFFRVFLGGH